MITQNQIAKMAGVSRATIARVINNKDDVQEETRQKVLDIINATGYRPNIAGKVLAIQRKQLKIGCLIVDADNPFYDELIFGINEQIEKIKSYGIEAIVERCTPVSEKQIERIDYMLSQHIDALVIQPLETSLLFEKLSSLTEEGIPVVTLNADLPGFTSFCYIGNDFYRCGNVAANLMELFTNGNCNIGIITGFPNATAHTDRINGFKDYIASVSNMNIIEIAPNYDDEMESYHVTKNMLEKHPEINALFITAGGVRGAGEAAKSLMDSQNRKYTIVSFDDVPSTRELIRQGIISASISQQPILQGQLAISVLFDYLVDGKLPKSNKIHTTTQIKIKANIDM